MREVPGFSCINITGVTSHSIGSEPFLYAVGYGNAADGKQRGLVLKIDPETGEIMEGAAYTEGVGSVLNAVAKGTDSAGLPHLYVVGKTTIAISGSTATQDDLLLIDYQIN